MIFYYKGGPLIFFHGGRQKLPGVEKIERKKIKSGAKKVVEVLSSHVVLSATICCTLSVSQCNAATLGSPPFLPSQYSRGVWYLIEPPLHRVASLALWDARPHKDSS